MVTHVLSEQQAAFTGATHYAEVTFADLTAAANTQTINIFSIVPKLGLLLVFAQLVDAFVSSDGTLISTAFTVGDTGSATRFLSSTETNNAGTPVWLKGGVALNPILNVYTANDTLQVFFTATAAKLLSTHTAGRLRIYYKVVDARGAGFPLVQ